MNKKLVYTGTKGVVRATPSLYSSKARTSFVLFLALEIFYVATRVENGSAVRTSFSFAFSDTYKQYSTTYNLRSKYKAHLKQNKNIRLFFPLE